MSESSFLFHSSDLPAPRSGELVHLPRQQAGWDSMSFFVRRLQPGQVFQARTEGEEAAFVLLGGTCTVDWGKGPKHIGKRTDVFDGFTHALFLPTGHGAQFTSDTAC